VLALLPEVWSHGTAFSLCLAPQPTCRAFNQEGADHTALSEVPRILQNEDQTSSDSGLSHVPANPEHGFPPGIM